MNTEREAFEQHMIKTGMDTYLHYEVDKQQYSNLPVQKLWKCWQATLANKPEAEPVIYISLSSLNWALSGIANGIGQFSYVEDKTDGGCNIPLYTAPPSTTALQKRIEELEDVFEQTIVIAKKYAGSVTLEKKAEDAIRALKAGDVQAPKEGWKLVPIEPTIPMLEKLFGGMMCGKHVHPDVYEPALRKYKAMIAAAPTDTEGK